MMYSIGLTGNIASGKTTVAQIFSDLGIEVLSADQISRELTAKNTVAYYEIVKHFGPKTLLENDDLDRRHLRELIFTHPEERLWLENLLHPLIRQQLEQKIKMCTSPYCVVEIPLLLDKKHYPYLNRILVVTAPLELQIARVMERDHCTQQQALAILSTQPELNERLKIADDVIINDSGYEQLKEAVIELHSKYLKSVC
ncbi:dephospho-CoA kinase [Legionella bononiensis]|uniref:Dephospho-CoA kinase n=1 Tax=Legionella bononiensis TaxID=2793102 RepID=A0ABS1WF61_9GAMM|nr:dephospho-CoA kinase [Legionella bononiensis]MBL7479291.1 dephospho-CoA kinase [Legionella bononiensis]MBL7527981.1 dephospho-CoA kinase [Legionella bononiensis]MBL7563942.1 dephospho-CoA kinase [Legionella bononiensis]